MISGKKKIVQTDVPNFNPDECQDEANFQKWRIEAIKASIENSIRQYTYTSAANANDCCRRTSENFRSQSIGFEESEYISELEVLEDERDPHVDLSFYANDSYHDYPNMTPSGAHSYERGSLRVGEKMYEWHGVLFTDFICRRCSSRYNFMEFVKLAREFR